MGDYYIPNNRKFRDFEEYSNHFYDELVEKYDEEERSVSFLRFCQDCWLEFRENEADMSMD